MNTSKLLIGIKNNIDSNEFLIPTIKDGKCFLIGIDTQKQYYDGMVVYIGKQISCDDLFSKLLDIKVKIESVKKTYSLIELYIKEVRNFKIGSEISIKVMNGDFKLEIKTPKK